MSFLTPYMLWGAVAAGIPIALHFFFRSRYRTVPWAAMKFLLTSIEQTSRRLRFQELLLLIARCLVLALLALALARPLSSVVRGGGRGDAVDAVFVFDVSYSMGASDGAVNRLDRAKAAALQVIDQLPAHSTVQIITCADRATVQGPRSPGNLDQARQLVQDLRLTSLASDIYPGIAKAQEVLRHGQATNKELYLFSDLQKLGWEQQAANVIAKLQEIHEKTTVFLVRCGDPARKIVNAAIVGITPQAGVPRPGERVGFAVLVRNTGFEEIKDLKISLAVDNDANKVETQIIDKLPPGETRAVTLAAQLGKPGLRVLIATIGHDDLPGDNRFDQVVLVRDRVNVLVIDGGINDREPEKSSSFFLVHALAPVKESDRAGHYLQPRILPPRLASPALLAKQDLCILVNVPLVTEKRKADALPADFVEELEKFVRQGKGVIIYAGDHVVADAYNRILGQKHGLLPMALEGFVDFGGKDKETVKINRDSVGIPAYTIFKEDDYYKGLGDAIVWKVVKLGEKQQPTANGSADPATNKNKDAVEVALRLSNGLPIVTTKKVDAGQVVFIATSADPGFKKDSPDLTWTDWPYHPVNVPFVQVTLSHLLQEQTQTHNLTAGETLRWRPGDKTLRHYSLVNPDGTTTRLGAAELVEERPLVTSEGLPEAGVYRLTTTGTAAGKDETPGAKETAPATGVPWAVIPDLRDSDNLEAYTDAQLDQRLGFRPIHMTAGEGPGASGADRLNREWTTWLVIAVLILAAGEAVLAWWCGQAW